MAPHKNPTDGSGVHPNSATLIHEEQFSEAIDDDVEVSLEDVYEHLNGEALPEGLAEVDGSLQLDMTVAEDHDGASIGDTSVVVGTPADSDGLGWGKQLLLPTLSLSAPILTFRSNITPLTTLLFLLLTTPPPFHHSPTLPPSVPIFTFRPDIIPSPLLSSLSSLRPSSAKPLPSYNLPPLSCTLGHRSYLRSEIPS
ncbi:uncharacterized protein EI90DRAFT_3118109 [Cantharellus anzutake]|uniref:uncharacterized protein n=1 Tax=Cantharellus anzutake TaxID=1750568 RepID=UPI0019083F98|nr:uncharacterized protein EI90DRAFT_3118109 [Cantharellus anzutake]KAF8339050.1 hypothetical protein EI90DRAFT_3118109 [Cantharellus anzutake]